MKLCTLACVAIAGAAGLANAQAITGFTGGSQFNIYYGASTGDVIGWRFTVNTDIFVTDLGVWNGDTQLGFEGLTSDHMVGIWNSDTGSLLISGTAGPGGTAVGAFTYTSVADTVLSTGGNYVIGAMYTATDGDSYISSASTLTTDPAVNFGGAMFPDAGDLGFVLPGQQSAATSRGRLGPNFLFRPVPTPGGLAVIGLGGLVAARRRR